MQIGYWCDIGQTNQLNEDSVLCLKLDMEFSSGKKSAGLFIVADGMGGHNAGEIASEWCIRIVAEQFLNKTLITPAKSAGKIPTNDNPQSILKNSVNTANRRLFERARKSKGYQGMGTTVTAALIIGHDLYVAHVGDSRCYIINERETMQVTKDHSYVQELVDAGLLTPEQARTHSQKNVITRALGYYREVTIDSHRLNLYQGDSVLLCSDGLWEVVPDKKIAELVIATTEPQQACLDLVNLANQLGGPDNISVVIIRPEHLPSLQEILAAETRMWRDDQ